MACCTCRPVEGLGQLRADAGDVGRTAHPVREQGGGTAQRSHRLPQRGVVDSAQVRVPVHAQRCDVEAAWRRTPLRPTRNGPYVGGRRSARGVRRVEPGPRQRVALRGPRRQRPEGADDDDDRARGRSHPAPHPGPASRRSPRRRPSTRAAASGATAFDGAVRTRRAAIGRRSTIPWPASRIGGRQVAEPTGVADLTHLRGRGADQRRDAAARATCWTTSRASSRVASQVGRRHAHDVGGDVDVVGLRALHLLGERPRPGHARAAARRSPSGSWPPRPGGRRPRAAGAGPRHAGRRASARAGHLRSRPVRRRS